jgi:transposase InsO family protein
VEHGLCVRRAGQRPARQDADGRGRLQQGGGAIAVDTSIPALHVTRVLDQVKAERGLPKVIRTDNGPEFAGRTMQTWAARNGVELRFIQPGKPVQNAYIESFNSRFRDEVCRSTGSPA